ncbi:MAG: hypothetical protein WCK77_08265 [Verrucomicrobiota bacterium]
MSEFSSKTPYRSNRRQNTRFSGERIRISIQRPIRLATLRAFRAHTSLIIFTGGKIPMLRALWLLCAPRLSIQATIRFVMHQAIRAYTSLIIFTGGNIPMLRALWLLCARPLHLSKPGLYGLGVLKLFLRLIVAFLCHPIKQL